MNLAPLPSLLFAVLVLLIGTLLNRRVPFLARYNIPDPISGGLLFAVIASIAAAAGLRLGVDQTFKPVLLLMFFAGVGMCADLRLLRLGARGSAQGALVSAANARSNVPIPLHTAAEKALAPAPAE